jgi:preprotein translocase subunit SecE
VTDTRATAATGGSGGAGHQAKGSLPARISLFYRQVVAELRKIIWPTRKQLVTYTSVVMVFVLMVIAYVTVLDFGFSKVIFAVFG